MGTTSNNGRQGVESVLGQEPYLVWGIFVTKHILLNMDP